MTKSSPHPTQTTALLPIGVFFHHLQSLQRLEDLPRHIPGANAEVGRAYAIPLTPSVDFDHSAHPHSSSQVQVTGRRCC